MVEIYNKWIDEFTKLVDKGLYAKAVEYLIDGFEIPFSKPSLYEAYTVASKIPNQYYKESFSKLLLGWLSFACGDNKRVNWVLNSVNESELETGDGRSAFYSLKSMITFMTSQEEGLKYAKLALDVLPKEKGNFIAGNAYMTYARQLTNVNRFRDGAEYFKKAYEIFRSLGSTFLSLNCFVSECLNLYALGLCREVIGKCQEILILNSSQGSKMEDYMNIIKLPMGICHYEMNKISIAIKDLNTAKIGIASLKLVHMHGMIEQYLFRCYRILKDQENMVETLEQLESIFENIHYPQIKYIIISMKTKVALSSQQTPKDEWIEELELAYQMNPESTPIYILEALTELKISGYSEVISKDTLIQHLEQFKLYGHIPSIQSISLYLAEFFYQEKDIETMKVYLKDACDIYTEYKLFAPFGERELKCFSYISNIDPSVINQFKKTGVSLQSNKTLKDSLENNLTNRELEILQLIGEGKSNKEISEVLFISIGTTKWHINNIFGKLEVKKRFEAIERARQLNIV